MYLTINIIIFVLILLLLGKVYKLNNKWSLAKKVITGLIAGILFGSALHLFYGAHTPILNESIKWFDIVGRGYVSLLQMVVMPLIFISILCSVTKLNNASSLGKISALTISTLLIMTMIAAIIGIGITLLFHLTSEGLTQGVNELKRLDVLNNQHLAKISANNIPDMLVSFIPTNIFLDLTGARSTSIIAVVIFAAFLGVAALQLFKEDEHKEKAQKLVCMLDLLQAWTIRLVRVVMKLTPYGVFALMTKMVASSNLDEILKLGQFVIASYIAIGLMFVVHSIFVMFVGINPIKFFQKTSSVLAFAFTSRSSAATIPLSIETQHKQFGVPNSIASFAASFGATIGQNGCAGIYPAMLATMVAPTMGIHIDLSWIAILVVVVTFSSIGVAGVGGGATFAALIVLPIMGLPIELIALLISVEPLIDMGRTALNVSGAITAGITTSRLLHDVDDRD